MIAEPAQTMEASDRGRRTVLRAVDVRKSFGHVEVVRGVSLEVREGEVVVIIGPSGSGKTTFLNCINLLVEPDGGEVWVEDERIGFSRSRNGLLRRHAESAVARQRQRIGFVFQEFNLFSHMTALQNIIEAPVHVLDRQPAEAEAEALALLEQVGLYGVENHYPAQLSGGQQQRVAIARALAMHPLLMLFDEPTSALDPEMMSGVLRVMENLAHKMTMVVVTHEMGFAGRAGTRIVMMDQGQIIEDAPPETFFDSPRTDRARKFLTQIMR